MSSRMDKYNSMNTSRRSRNKELYENLYSDTNYSNSVVIDDSQEIDINKIKELVDRENANNNKRPPKTLDYDYDDIEYNKDDDNKIYDINEVLKNAKNKRDIIEEASEKRKKNYKYQSLYLEEELAKTKKVYDKLVQEETELLDIMNTLTNVPTTNSDPYKDLTTDANKFKTCTVEVKQIDDEDTTKYNSNTFMFDTKDFVKGNIKEEDTSSNKFVKFLIFLLIVGIIVCAYFVITKYIMK